MKKSWFPIFFAVILVFFSSQARSDLIQDFKNSLFIVQDFENSLLNGDYPAAKKYVETMYRTNNSAARNSSIDGYANLIQLFESEQRFDRASKAYLEIKSHGDYYIARDEFNRFATLSKIYKSYDVSDAFIQKLNEKLLAANKQIGIVEETRRIAEQERLVAEQERMKEQEELQRKVKEQREKEASDRQAKWQDEQNAREEAYRKERVREDREENVRQKRAADVVQERKKLCGDDYLTPKIGMSIERAQKCVGNFRLTSQLNRADGVVSTYSAVRTYLHVIDGRIVSWGRY